MNQKTTLLLIISTLFVALSAGGAYLFMYNNDVRTIDQVATSTSTAQIEPAINELPDSTADWEIYRNDLYDFSFKYPLAWSYSHDDSVSQQDSTVFFFDEKKAKNPQRAYLPWEGISVRVASNEGSLSLSEFATNLYKEATGNIPHRNDILKWNFLEISQHPALKVLGVPSCCSEYLVLVSLKDAARIIVFSLDSGSVPLDPNDISKYENVLLKMLESLQL